MLLMRIADLVPGEPFPSPTPVLLAVVSEAGLLSALPQVEEMVSCGRGRGVHTTHSTQGRLNTSCHSSLYPSCALCYDGHLCMTVAERGRQRKYGYLGIGIPPSLDLFLSLMRRKVQDPLTNG